MRVRYFLFIYLSIFLMACSTAPSPEAPAASIPDGAARSFQGFSLLGDSLFSPPPGEKLLERYEARKADFLEDPDKVDNIIWHGRFTAYIGQYQEAIQIYTDGIRKFPDDARLYRHRGHRHLTIRQYDQAITDFEKAAELIQGTENQIEPDGMPNAQNIPVSTLHGNIYYHLGLAYYLKQDMPKALEAYQKCLASSDNNDNLVSSTHWLYMISRRLDQDEQAQAYLEPIHQDLEIIENMAYHQACLFYKGELEESALRNPDGDAPANDALAYALANWAFYHGDLDQAKAGYEAMLEQASWNSFGYLAAESDYYHHFL
jgi:tetratricopeptide (TPR) repeat protein